MAAAEEGAGADERARRKILRELRAVGGVELVVEREIGAENLHEDEVIHAHASGRKGVFVIIEKIFEFVFNFLGSLAGLGIEADASRKVERVSSKDGFAERQLGDRTRRVDDATFRLGFSLRESAANGEDSREAQGNK